MLPALPSTFFLALLISLFGEARYNQLIQTGPPPGEPAILKPESVSPYLIEWFIDVSDDADLKQVWRLLKIDTPDDKSYRCGGNCSAETFDIPTGDKDQDKTVALKISFESGDLYQYLFFKRVAPGAAKEEWKFIGKIDSRSQKYGPPAHRVESGDGRTWFVIKELWGAGTGMQAYGEAWYEIKESGLKRVLSYPVEGHNTACQKNTGHSYKSIILRYGIENGVYIVPIQFLASYNISDCEKGNDSRRLFAKGHKAYYVWDNEKERFLLDRSRSDITEEEIASLYNMEGLSDEKFLAYNIRELLDLAGVGDAAQRNWLRRFLAGLQESPLKASLRQALQK